MAGTPGGKPKPKPPTSNVPKGVDAKRKADAQAASDHRDQRTIIHQTMKELGINKIDSTTIPEIRAAIEKYSIKNGTSLKDLPAEIQNKLNTLRVDAAQIRKDRAAQMQKLHQTPKPDTSKGAADLLKQTVKTNSVGKPKGAAGGASKLGGGTRSKGGSGSSSGGSKSGGTVDRSEAVRKAWVTRRKNAS